MQFAKYFSDSGIKKLRGVYEEMGVEITEDLFISAFDDTFKSRSDSLEYVSEYGAQLEFSGVLFANRVPRYVAFKASDFVWADDSRTIPLATIMGDDGRITLSWNGRNVITDTGETVELPESVKTEQQAREALVAMYSGAQWEFEEIC